MSSNETIISNDEATPSASLRYYHTLRDEATNVVRSPGSNVDVFVDPQGEEVVLCHLSNLNFFFPFFDALYEQVWANIMAVNHLNTGNGTFVPAIEGLNERCPIRYTIEFAESSTPALGLGNVIEQTSRLPNSKERIPCAFLGAGTSAISQPTSIVTGLLGYMQVSNAASAPDLDDKTSYPLFGRTVPQDEGNTVAVITFLQKVFGIKNLVIVNNNESYGNGYARAMREAAAVHAPDMEILQIPTDDGTPEGIASAVSQVKKSGFRYIFIIVFEIEAFLAEAHKQGIAGDGSHVWLGGNSFRGPTFFDSYEEGDPLIEAYAGTAKIEFTAGIQGDPDFDSFTQSFGALNNPVDLSFAEEELYPKLPPQMGTNPYLGDSNFLSTVNPAFGSAYLLAYEAAVATGLAACNAITEDNILTGAAHFDALRDLSFESVTGTVSFDAETGTRNPDGILFKVTNWVPEQKFDGKMGFKQIVTHLKRDGEWIENVPFVFNDGTTNIPADLPPSEEYSSNDDFILPLVVGATAFFLILMGIIAYLIYDRKNKANDAIHKVKREDIVFANPPEVLGRGSFGLVLLGEYRGTSVAVKHLVRSSGGGSKSVDGSLSSKKSESVTNLDSMTGDGYVVSMSEKHSATMDSGTLSSSVQWKAGKHSGIMSVGSATGSAMTKSKAVKTKTQKKEVLVDEILEEMNILAKLRHVNITTFMGVVLDKEDPMILMEYMEFGSLYDVLQNRTMQIDGEIIQPVLRDIVQGVQFLHSAETPIIHGDLKAANILIDSHFRAKVADFGLSQKTEATGTPYWMAPELLRREGTNTTESDVYSFGVILYEVYARKDPYENESPKEVLELVVDKDVQKRPGIPEFMPPKMQAIMTDCLDEEAGHRPPFQELNTRLKRISTLAANPTNNGSVANRAQRFEETFPLHIAEALKEGHQIEPEHKDMVTILASDIVGFDKMSVHWSQAKVKNLLDRFHGKLDELCKKHDIFKVQATGVSYFAVANLVKDQSQDHCKRCCAFATEAIAAAGSTLLDEADPLLGNVVIRVGIHCGPVIGGIVGTRMPRYSLFGDTINTAMKMECTSDSNRISLSKRAGAILGEQDPSAILEDRGPIRISGKGKMHCYWLGESSAAGEALARVLARKQNRMIASKAEQEAEKAPEQAPEQAPPPKRESAVLVPLEEAEEATEQPEEDEEAGMVGGSAATEEVESFDSEFQSKDDSPV